MNANPSGSECGIAPVLGCRFARPQADEWHAFSVPEGSVTQRSLGRALEAARSGRQPEGKQAPVGRAARADEELKGLASGRGRAARRKAKEVGAGDEIRTRDFLLGKQTLYH